MAVASHKLLGRDSTVAASRRRWRIPPPVTRDPEAPGPEGLTLLEEHPGEDGLLLWLTLRNVLLWSRVPAASRKGLFMPEAMERRLALLLEMRLPPRLDEPLTLLAGLLDRPHIMEPALVSLSCLRIHDWALDEGFPATSLEFLQAASVACPGDGRYALAVARALRERNLHGRAEAWFLRAIGLTRQARDWEAYTQTYTAYGYMMIRRGNFPLARRLLTKAVRRAARQGLKEPRARAHHDLFVVESECGDIARANHHAEEALHAYSAGHANLPALAHDVAYFWTKQGEFRAAIPLLEATLPHLPQDHQAACLGALGRAQGAVGRRGAFQECFRALRSRKPGFGVAEAWVDMGHGALSLGLKEEAQQAAQRAQALAQDRSEAKVEFLAEALLDAARKLPTPAAAFRRSGESRQESPSRPRLHDRASSHTETLAGEFVFSLASVP